MPAIPTISPSNDQGFTLVEMLMAMLIMTVGLLGLLQSLQVAYQHSTRNRMREEGILLAEEQMDEFRRRSFDSITANNVFTAATSVRSGIAAGGRNDLFSVTRDSRQVGNTQSKKLSVTVKWCFRNVTSSHVLYSMKNR